MDSFVKQLRDNWVIIIFIGSLIVSWTNTNARLALAEKERADLFNVASEIQEIKISVAVIKEKVTSIENKI
jgi:hypothetical protein